MSDLSLSEVSQLVSHKCFWQINVYGVFISFLTRASVKQYIFSIFYSKIVRIKRALASHPLSNILPHWEAEAKLTSCFN